MKLIAENSLCFFFVRGRGVVRFDLRQMMFSLNLSNFLLLFFCLVRLRQNECMHRHQDQQQQWQQYEEDSQMLNRNAFSALLSRMWIFYLHCWLLPSKNERILCWFFFHSAAQFCFSFFFYHCSMYVCVYMYMFLIPYIYCCSCCLIQRFCSFQAVCVPFSSYFFFLFIHVDQNRHHNICVARNAQIKCANIVQTFGEFVLFFSFFFFHLYLIFFRFQLLVWLFSSILFLMQLKRKSVNEERVEPHNNWKFFFFLRFVFLSN